MSFKTALVTLAAAVANGGTITVSYPAGTNKGTFTGGLKHTAFSRGLQQSMSVANGDFTVTFNTASIAVVYNGTTPIPAGSAINFQFDMLGRNNPFERTGPVSNLPGAVGTVSSNMAKTSPQNDAQLPKNLYLQLIELGSPTTAAANNLSTSAAVLAASPTGAVLLALAAALDVPRNIVAAWTGTSVLTVRGLDKYGNALTESSASGTSFTGKKAFASVTSAKFSADVTGCTIGTGVVLGLPIVLPEAGLVFKEIQDGVTATAGTIAAADATVPATATTGDVRGTYNPNAAPDGSKSYQLVVAIPDPIDIGFAQFSG